MFSASYSYLKKAKHSHLAETYKENIYLKFIITKSSEQSSRWDADSRSARQAISRHLCNLNFYYRLNKKKLYIYTLVLVPILNQMNPVNSITGYFLHINSIHLCPGIPFQVYKKLYMIFFSFSSEWASHIIIAEYTILINLIGILIFLWYIN